MYISACALPDNVKFLMSDRIPNFGNYSLIFEDGPGNFSIHLRRDQIADLQTFLARWLENNPAVETPEPNKVAA